MGVECRFSCEGGGGWGVVGAGLNIASYTEGLGHLFGGVCPP